MFQLAKPGEPLYAQVNREKKKNRQYEAGAQPQYDGQLPPGPGDMWGYEEPVKGMVMDGHRSTPAGGDSWVWNPTMHFQDTYMPTLFSIIEVS